MLPANSQIAVCADQQFTALALTEITIQLSRHVVRQCDTPFDRSWRNLAAATQRTDCRLWNGLHVHFMKLLRGWRGQKRHLTSIDTHLQRLVGSDCVQANIVPRDQLHECTVVLEL